MAKQIVPDDKSKEKAMLRLRELLTLQEKVEQQFGNMNYNVFVFGSYLTTKYVEGQSDIFFIDTKVEAPVYCAPLKSKVQFTDYYPKKLVHFEQACQQRMEENRAKLNDFTQVFKDLIIFIRKEEGTYKGGASLRYCMMSFDTFDFQQTAAELEFVSLLRRARTAE